ncbi:class I SAM-dependent methyltransferase [Haloechinothrix salitolerans]|uniref:Class I SAM-dependent methyltransferase n=1 Tax=Haloechinothrix salitolerans TaxID=926830 RepID=A0ABW2C794_9PSEU
MTPGQTAVDVGCGTGNLSFAVLRAQPNARITGLDPDERSLRRGPRTPYSLLFRSGLVLDEPGGVCRGRPHRGVVHDRRVPRGVRPDPRGVQDQNQRESR